jgi:hypothetical protein
MMNPDTRPFLFIVVSAALLISCQFPTLPIADAGPDLTGTVSSTVTLDGSASSHPDSEPLEYRWTFAALPAASGLTNASINNADHVISTFIPDVSGEYRVELEVSALGQVATDQVVVTITDASAFPDDAFGEWLFTAGSLDDTSGNNNDIGSTNNYSSVADYDGVPGNAIALSGSLSYLNAEIENSLFDAGSYLSISLWLNASFSNADVGPILSIFESASTGDVRIVLDSSAFDFYTGSSSSEQLSIDFSSASLTDGTWNHFAFIWNKVGGLMEVYVNGSSVGSGNLSFVDTSVAYIDFGRNLIPSAEFYSGSIDNIRLYSRQLSIGEISELASE